MAKKPKTVGFKPMLADPIEPEKYPLKFPLFVSTKLDGIRCVVRDGVALSRSLKPIPNEYVQAMLARPEFNGLDGELIVGPPNAHNAMQMTEKGVMKIKGTPDFTWYVFDDCTHPEMTFVDRFKSAGVRVALTAAGNPLIKVLGHGVARDQEQLDQMEAIALKAGFEGLMVRAPHGRYKWGRSTAKEGLLNKVKRFTDAEADVIGFEELMINENEAVENELGNSQRSSCKANLRPGNSLGSLVCQLLDKEGGRVFVLQADGSYQAVTFNIGTFDGVTAEERAQLWQDRESLVGRIAKFRHFAASGVKDAPRFPVFVCWRNPLDMSA